MLNKTAAELKQTGKAALFKHDDGGTPSIILVFDGNGCHVGPIRHKELTLQKVQCACFFNV